MQSVHFQWTDWKWQSAAAGGVAGLTTVVALHPLDIVRTRFQVHDGLRAAVPSYRHTFHALFTIGRVEGLRGLYAGLVPAVFGSSLSWSLYFFLYSNIKERNRRQFHRDALGPSLHLLSAAEAGSIVAVLTNPVWVVKTRLQLQSPGHGARPPYLGFSDACKRILREEGLRGLYKGLGPGLLLVSHGALQFMAYEEGRKFLISHRVRAATGHPDGEQLVTSQDFALLGASSKLFAVMATYPYQVIRSQLQQRPSVDVVSRYVNTWHTFQSIMRYEGFRGLYKGIVPNLLRVVPSSSLTFLVYESVMKFLQ
jgi:solute carrier family 25 folate transporter 32